MKLYLTFHVLAYGAFDLSHYNNFFLLSVGNPCGLSSFLFPYILPSYAIFLSSFFL